MIAVRMLTYYLQTIQFFFLIYNSLNNLSQWASESVSTHPSVWTRSWPAPARRRPGRPGHSSCSAGWEEAGCCSPRCHWTDHLSTVAATWNMHRDIQREFIMWSGNTVKKLCPNILRNLLQVWIQTWSHCLYYKKLITNKTHYWTCWWEISSSWLTNVLSKNREHRVLRLLYQHNVNPCPNTTRPQVCYC